MLSNPATLQHLIIIGNTPREVFFIERPMNQRLLKLIFATIDLYDLGFEKQRRQFS